MTLAVQKEIHAQGDVAAGNISKDTHFHYNGSTPTQLEILYDNYLIETGTNHPHNNEIKEFIESLEHYFKKPPSDLKIVLRQKLEESNRLDLIDEAEEQKENAMKKIMRFQNSSIAQSIFAHTLADIRTRFKYKVKPLILNNCPRNEIDNAIYEEVISPIVKAAKPCNLDIDTLTVEAFIYFLAGNCYINWK